MDESESLLIFTTLLKVLPTQIKSPKCEESAESVNIHLLWTNYLEIEHPWFNVLLLNRSNDCHYSIIVAS